MEYFDVIMKNVDVNLVFCLIPMIITLGFINRIFKQRFQTVKALNLVRWFIVGYTILVLFRFLVGITTMPEEYNYLLSSTGLYNAVYWILLILAMILPFTLLHSKLGANFLYILLLSFLMKLGVYFERFVIVTTSLNRDYEPNYDNPSWYDSVTMGVVTIWIQGMLLAILSLWVLDLLKHKKIAENTSHI